MPRNSNTTEKLVSDFKLITQDLEEFLKTNSSTENWEEAPRQAPLSRAIENAKATYQKVEKKMIEGAKATDQTIKTHPYQTMGIAFGIGLALGFLWKRR